MKSDTKLFFVIALLLFGCGPEITPADQPTSSSPAHPSAIGKTTESDLESDGGMYGLGAYVSFSACGVKIRQPEGFVKVDSFDGFGQPGTRTSVMATRIGGPYGQVVAGFTQESMAVRGMILRSREDVEVDDLAGILLSFEQPVAGEVFSKWLLAFGDDKKTTIVTATFPKKQERELSAKLKAAVLSTELDSVAALTGETDLPFTLVASQQLKLTPVLNKMLIYTRDGVVPVKSPEEPLFIAAPALGQVQVEDKQKFAEQRLHQIVHTKNIALKTTEGITIDGLRGYESLAEAEDAKSKMPLLVYQVILFDDESYILMQGLVGAAIGGEFLPEFKAMAHSLKRK